LTTLEDRFERYETPVHITGVQAMARVVVDSAARFTGQLAALAPPPAAAAGAAAGPVRSHHDGQE
jgi:hypothetical protein